MILASSSPRRRELLTAAGFEFKTVAPDVEERFDPDLTLRELTLSNATRKGIAVARLYPDEIVIAADTLVAFNGDIIGKPANFDDAATILRRLSGNVHEVCSAVLIVHSGSHRSKSFCETSLVYFRTLSEGRIQRYLAKVQPLDKAGAYAAQGQGAEIIARIEGSYSNVVGLPLERTVPLLAAFGITPRRRT